MNLKTSRCDDFTPFSTNKLNAPQWTKHGGSRNRLDMQWLHTCTCEATRLSATFKQSL